MNYEIRIDENGMGRTNSIWSTERDVRKVALQIIESKHVREGAVVRFARVSYYPPTDSFEVTEFRFTVKDGRPEGVETVR